MIVYRTPATGLDKEGQAVIALGIGFAHRYGRGLTLLGAVVAITTACSGNQHTAATPPAGRTPSLVPSKSTSRPPARTSSPATQVTGLPNPNPVNGNDATAVSRAALTVIWTTDASVDSGGLHDAQLRALPFLTPAYAAQIQAAQPNPPPPDAWVRNRVHTRVTMRPGAEETPPDTATTAYRQWILTVTSVDTKGRHQVPPVRVVAYVILVHTAGRPWRVSAVNTY